MVKESRRILIKKLDSVFSLFIRLKFADKNGNVRCFTCGAFKHYKEIQNGHYVTRGKYSTRWDEDNCRPQCYGCNIGRNGNYPVFSQKLGMKKIDELVRRGNLTVKYSDIDIKELINKYEEFVEKRKKELSL